MVSTDNDETRRSAVEERSKALFDGSVANLSGTIRSKLAQARRVAIAAPRQSDSLLPRQWLPAVGAAMVVLAVTAVLFTGATLRRPTPEAMPAIDDLALLLDDDSNFDLIEELEFYSWLDAEHSDYPS